jgi:hypothetical protein
MAKGRTVEHDRDEFGDSARAQSVEQFGHERLYLIELHDDRALFDLGGRQFNRLISFEQEPRVRALGLLFTNSHFL